MGLMLGDVDPPEAEVEPEGEAQESGETPGSPAESEWPFEVRLVELAWLVVDSRYQRPLEEPFVRRQAEDFEESLVGAIDVSDRGDAGAILDGQQRFEMMKLVGKTRCYAAVFSGMSLEDEAGFFYRKNRDRRAMRGFYGFRARLVAGDLEAVAVDEIVRENGFELGPKTDHQTVIGAVAAIEAAWELSSGGNRSESLTPVLRTLRTTWRGSPDSLAASVVAALARFWAAFPDEAVEAHGLRRAMEGVIGTPLNLVALGREAQAPGVGLSAGMSLALVDAYNRVAGTQLDPGQLGKR